MYDEERKIVVAMTFTNGWKLTSAVEVYDIDSDSWSTVQSLPFTGRGTGFTIGDHLAVMQILANPIIHLFHPENGTWSALTHKTLPIPYKGFSVNILAIHSDKLTNQCSLA